MAHTEVVAASDDGVGDRIGLEAAEKLRAVLWNSHQKNPEQKLNSRCELAKTKLWVDAINLSAAAKPAELVETEISN